MIVGICARERRSRARWAGLLAAVALAWGCGDVAKGGVCELPGPLHDAGVSLCRAELSYLECEDSDAGTTCSCLSDGGATCPSCSLPMSTCSNACSEGEYAVWCGVELGDGGRRSETPAGGDACRVRAQLPSGASIYCCSCR